MSLDNYKILTAPTMNPVKLCDVKDWCKVTTDDDDVLLENLIDSATQKAELFTNRVFINRTFTGYIECMQRSDYEKGYFLELRRAPVSSVTSVKVMVDDAQVTVSADDYNLKETSSFPRIIFEEINESPDLIPYPYEVVFVAGYGATSDSVPAPIKTAINMMISYWYQNRGDCDGVADIPALAMGILREYRVVNTFG